MINPETHQLTLLGGAVLYLLGTATTFVVVAHWMYDSETEEALSVVISAVVWPLVIGVALIIGLFEVLGQLVDFIYRLGRKP